MGKFKEAPEAAVVEKDQPKWMNGKTPEQIEKVAARIQDNKKRRQEAIQVLVMFVKNYGDENIKKAASTLFSTAMGVGAVRASSGSRVSSNAFLKSLLPAVGSTMPEMDIFIAHQLGRREMRDHIIRNIKQSAPEERLWVKLDFSTKSYVLQAIGSTPPEDWSGYRPADA